MTRLGDDVVSAFFHGSNRDVDTTAEPLVTAPRPATRGVQLKAAADNTGTIYVGASAAVTAGTSDASDGFPLAGGEGLFLPIDDAAKIFLIATAADQKVFWVSV